MTTAETLHSHGDVLANMPGMLGYFPTDSLVLVFYTDSDDIDCADLDRDGDTVATLGPITRIDLDDAIDQLTDNAWEFLALAHQHDLIAVAAYIIGTGNTALQQAEAITAELCGNPLFPQLLSVVVTDNITTGTVYQTVYTHPKVYSGAAQGRISNVATSATMRDMINRSGAVPDTHRDNVTARLNSTAHGINAEDYPQLLFDVASFSAYETSIVALQRTYETATRGIGNAGDIAAIRAGLQCFTTPALRDPLLAALMEAPNSQHSLVFAETLMRAVPEEWHSIRAQVTTTFAMLAYATHQPSLAAHAAHEAVDLAPNNNYANLIAKALDANQGKAMLHSAVTGGRLARTELFEGYITAAARPQPQQQ